MTNLQVPALRVGRLPLTKESLAIELRDTGDRASRLVKLIGGDTAAYAALTVGDLLYDAFRIDPLAWEAMAFARKAMDLSDIFCLSRYAADMATWSERSLGGAISNLQGYVAERVACHALLASGADVRFPETSNQAGWDLLVNGEKFQVKCLESPAGVYDHFVKYPDISVIANSELASAFDGDDRVTILGFSHEEVIATTNKTLDAAADLLDLEIPMIATAVGVARAGIAVLRSESDLARALGAASVGVAAGIGGGKGGAIAAGAALGLVGVAGGWPAIIAPVFGSILGYRGGRLVGDQLKRSILCRAEATHLNEATKDFARQAARVLAGMVSSSEAFRERVSAMADTDFDFAQTIKADWLRRIDREIDRRQFYWGRLAAAAEDPRSIDPSTREPRALALRVMWAAAQGGVLLANVRIAAEGLRAAVTAYERALKRWLLQ